MTDTSRQVVEANLIPGKNAVEDGAVTLMVAKLHSWITPSKSYNQAQTGVSFHPAGTLLLRVPVEGIEEGSVLTPLQLGGILQAVMSSIVPACGAFVTAVSSNYGVVEDEPEPNTGSGDF